MAAKIIKSAKPARADDGRFVAPSTYMMLRDGTVQVAEVPARWRWDGVSWPRWALPLPLVLAVIAVFVYLAEQPYIAAGMGAWIALYGAWFAFMPREALAIASGFHDYARQSTRRYALRETDAIMREAMRALGIWAIWRVPISIYIGRTSNRLQHDQPDFMRMDYADGIEWVPAIAS